MANEHMIDTSDPRTENGRIAAQREWLFGMVWVSQDNSEMDPRVRPLKAAKEQRRNDVKKGNTSWVDPLSARG